MTDLPFPKGFRDLLPNEALFRSRLISGIEEIFRDYGFLNIYTPKLEPISILRAKESIGEESKLIFELKQENLGLRYDQTVSLARYFIMHSNLPLPFKRYSIGEVWRMDEPQRLRYREFTQADVDIIGGDTVKSNAEVIASISKVYESLGVDYEIRINDRKIMNSIFDKIGIGEDSQVEAMRIIDKLDKIGVEGVRKSLSGIGLGADKLDKMMDAISLDGDNDKKLSYLKDLLGEESINEMASTIELLKYYNLKGEILVDLSIVRGIDYYTSLVFEFKVKGERSSISSGGRYDNLISTYGGKSIGAVGGSIGVDRLMDILNFQDSKEFTPSSVFIVTLRNSSYGYAIKVANMLRDNGISTDMNISDRSISNQLAYANSLNFKYTLFIGKDEEEKNSVKLKNMVDGKEEFVELDNLVSKMKLIKHL